MGTAVASKAPRDATLPALITYAAWAAESGAWRTALHAFEAPEWVAQADGSLHREVRTKPLASGLLEAVKAADGIRFGEVLRTVADDPLFAEWDGGMVGTPLMSGRFELVNLIGACVGAQITPGGQLDANEDAVRRRFESICQFFTRETVDALLTVPLSGIQVEPATPGFPLWDGNYIGRLEAREFEACAEAGVVLPLFAKFPQIPLDRGGFGIRLRIPVPVTRLHAGEDAPLSAVLPGQSKRCFGDLSPSGLPELVDDLLFALRIGGTGKVEAFGATLTCELPFSGTAFQTFRRGNPIAAHYPLSAAVAESIGEVWTALRGVARGGRVPRIAIRRYNTALEEPVVDDAIADLAIASEALFLRDQSSDRGELGFRIRLRAAKLLEKEGFNPRKVLKVFTVAYNLRSVVAHGGEISEPIKCDGEEMAAREFLDRAAELMRAALRVATLKYRSDSFGTSDFWDSLVFP